MIFLTTLWFGCCANWRARVARCQAWPTILKERVSLAEESGASASDNYRSVAADAALGQYLGFVMSPAA